MARMINGAHIIVYSQKAEADRDFLRDVLGFSFAEQRWGSITQLVLPSGAKIGVYQPKHASPIRKTTP